MSELTAGGPPLLGRLDWLEAADKIPLFLQLTPAARFKEDLGLDSLDAVEVVMAVEEVRNLAFQVVAQRDPVIDGTYDWKK